MIVASPRASSFRALRESRLTSQNRHFRAVRTNRGNQFVGPGTVPAYSVTDDILAVGFSDNAATEGSILCRYTPTAEDGKEATSLQISSGGGGCWCPTNNKFYFGATQLNQPTGDGMAVRIDPTHEWFSAITGFPTGFGAHGGRCIYIPTTDEVWVGLSDKWAVINPADDTVSLITSPPPNDVTYCPTSDAIYYSTFQIVGGVAVGAIAKIDSSRTVTILTLPPGVTGTGAIDYVDSLDIILVRVAAGGSDFLYQIDPATDTVSGYSVSGFGPTYLYYAAFADRLIMQGSPGSYILSYTPDLGSFVVITGDELTAAKGVYCDSVSKIALPVLTGPGGARYYTVHYFGAGDL